MTHHVFFFDGTNNGLSDEHPTNIALLYHALDTIDADQKAYHYAGPGDDDREENWLGSVCGKVYGDDVNEIVTTARWDLSRAWSKGDRVSAFGFSRGAGCARRFAQKVCEVGTVPGFLISEFSGVDFLGCFDTVTGFGRIGNWLDRKLDIESLFADTDIHPNIKKAFHIVAMNERRMIFWPTLMTQAPNVYEIWLKGDHCDIGGGHPKDERWHSNFSLEWMVDEARMAGLKFKWSAADFPVNAEMPPHGPPDYHNWIFLGDRDVPDGV